MTDNSETKQHWVLPSGTNSTVKDAKSNKTFALSDTFLCETQSRAICLRLATRGNQITVCKYFTKRPQMIQRILMSNEIHVLHELASKTETKLDGVLMPIGTFETKVAGTIGIEFPYMNGGDMFDYMLTFKKTSRLIPEDTLRIIFKPVATTLVQLHAIKCAHRDVKLENILLTSQNEAKLCDFQFATFYHFHKTSMCETREMPTAPFIAPESAPGFKLYNPYLADVWSFGICLLNAATTWYAYNVAGDVHYNEFVLALAKGKLPDRYLSLKLSPKFVEFVCFILCVDPTKRPTMQQVVDHAWWKGEAAASP